MTTMMMMGGGRQLQQQQQQRQYTALSPSLLPTGPRFAASTTPRNSSPSRLPALYEEEEEAIVATNARQRLKAFFFSTRALPLSTLLEAAAAVKALFTVVELEDL
mmetsp:Transcript_8964/g.17493  ORF Transcript_8964/g.17493 Transcript_8964/m.17493 type:complete len:105 (-) Transcript_8964:268-582(-)